MTTEPQLKENLTQWEYLALNSELNIADGHARQALSPGQQKIVNELPVLWAESEQRPVQQIESEAHQAYFTLLGQHRYPAEPGRVLSCYSSSVSMEILARSLSAEVDRVALVHPTFDNIADLLRGNGLELVPVEEDALHGEDLAAELLSSVGCVFVTTPNNPTGRVLAQERLRRLAEQCAEHGIVLALDTSFRGFDAAAHYDHYAVLEEVGCRWVVIEDTGKLWPTLDLKAGLLVSSDHVDLPIEKIYSDILLGVSPLILALIREFSRDAADGGLADLHAFIRHNRSVVRRTLAGVEGVSFPDPESRSSVERVAFAGRTGTEVWEELQRHRVFALPCRQFHWAEPSDGDHMMRIALARSTEPLEQSVQVLRTVLETR
ncbi:enduracididine biosynthesis enzyme MppP [Streptomyces platensis]|uniref:enduracididine biosynthesis enzyme MppP n=1 Tax=Streptomyces platensis TaxID=58346 RepID=UPI001F451615|nr:enduracididine biosynthesis enzyme MppP [Streptomyces platensis]